MPSSIAIPQIGKGLWSYSPDPPVFPLAVATGACTPSLTLDASSAALAASSASCVPDLTLTAFNPAGYAQGAGDCTPDLILNAVSQVRRSVPGTPQSPALADQIATSPALPGQSNISPALTQ